SSMVIAAIESWPFQLFYWVLFAPLLLTGITWACYPPLGGSYVHLGVVFVLALVLVSTALGRGLVGILGHFVARLFTFLRDGFVQGFVKFLVDFFKELVHLFESLFHVVDEWLRFRSGENWATRAARMVLAVIWFPVSYLARVYFLVLIEPGFNPIKMPI